MTNDPWLAACKECGGPIELQNIYSFWQKVEGYERRRKQGGQNHLALPRRREEFICEACMTKLQNGVGTNQLDLSANT